MRANCSRLVAGLVALVLVPGMAVAQGQQDDKAELGGLPRFQRALRLLEEGRGYLEIAKERAASELRDPARRAAEEVDAAIAQINAVLDKAKVNRESRPGQVDESKRDQPVIAAREALDAARDQLERVDEKHQVEARAPKARIRQAMEIMEEGNQRREAEQKREEAKRKGGKR